MTDYVMTARKREWVPEWLWRIVAFGGLVAHVGPLRRWLTEPVPYEVNGVWWLDRE